jgi:ankyrin repeat protein
MLDEDLLNAVKNNDRDRVRQLISAGASVNAKGEYGRTALMTAADEGYVECLNALIAAGADLNAKGLSGTALINAARSGRLVCLESLIAAGADVHAAHGDGSTALVWAASDGSSDCVRALIAAGVNVNADGNMGNTALLAASRSSVDCVEALISAGANVNAQGNFGNTPLIYAARFGQLKCVKALIAAGADLNMKDVDGRTALTWASKGGHKDCLEALISAGDGAASQSTEIQANRLLAIWQGTEIDFFGKERKQCGECKAALTPVDEGFTCKGCGRRIVAAEYVVQDRDHYKHKVVIDIGQQLAQAGGTTAMVAVAHRFSALGGRMSDLSRCWHGVGGWMH